MHSSRKGQTIIEVMIALGLLTMGLLGLLDLLSQSFFLDRVISDQTKATYLAAEGVEIAKSLIDNDVYLTASSPTQSPGWDACFGLGVGQTKDYELDYSSLPSTASTSDPSCAGLKLFEGNGDFLNFNSSTDLYSYLTGGTPTNFTRDIRITATTTNELEVQSIVHWSTGPITSQSIDLQDDFYNWYPGIPSNGGGGGGGGGCGTDCGSGGGGSVSSTVFGFSITDSNSGSKNIPTPPFSIYRFWDSPNYQWSYLEDKSPGCTTIACLGGYDSTNMTNFDSFMAGLYAKNPDMVAIYNMARTPTWASSNTTDSGCSYGDGECDRPADLNTDGSGSNQTFRQWYAYFSSHVNNSAYLNGTGAYAGTPHAHIEYWEVWNEPDTAKFWGNGKSPEGIGSYDDLIRLTEDAECIIVGNLHNIPSQGGVQYETYKDGNGVYDTCAQVQAAVGLTGPTDPSALIISPSFHPKGSYSMEDLQSYLYCTGSQSCTGGDTKNAGAFVTMVLNMHMKPGDNCVPSGNNCTTNTMMEPTYNSYISLLDEYVAKGTGLGASTPIWDDEADYAPDSFYVSADGASGGPYTETDMAESYVARFIMYGLSDGVTENTWYAWDHVTASDKSAFDTAWTTTYDWLASSTAGPGMCSNTGTVYTCKFTGANGKPAETIWDTNQSCSSTGNCTISSQNVGTSWTTCATLDSSTEPSDTCKVSGGFVNVTIKPELLQ